MNTIEELEARLWEFKTNNPKQPIDALNLMEDLLTALKASHAAQRDIFKQWADKYAAKCRENAELETTLVIAQNAIQIAHYPKGITTGESALKRIEKTLNHNKASE
jgi:hypothetical protein